MLPAVRISTAALMGAGTGLILGLSHGAKTIALRYRAENAHRLPTTHKGWYLYHKSKNYNCMLGGLKEGGEMAVKIGFWTMAFFTVENSMDKLRNDQKDVFNTMVAGVSTAGAFSVWSESCTELMIANGDTDPMDQTDSLSPPLADFLEWACSLGASMG